MIKAQVVADSKNEFGNRITTMVVTFPRFILAEFNTHRMFSRNSASSRAIPFEKMLKSVEENPFIPIAWQKDHKGMQGTEYFTNTYDILALRSDWLKARDKAVYQAISLSKAGLTKQLCNRLLEPFMWHTVIITATEFENFFALRCPQYKLTNDNGTSYRSRKEATFAWNIDSKSDLLNDNQYWLMMNRGQAEIHMMALAEAMWDAYNESIPKELKAGEWHIPFGDGMNGFKLIDLAHKEITKNKPEYSPNKDEIQEVVTKLGLKIATARCARVSYTVVGEENRADNYENDIKLHDRLAASGHWSPFEHIAKAMSKGEFDSSFVRGTGEGGPDFYTDEWSGNFRGFTQYRKTFTNENITKK